MKCDKRVTVILSLVIAILIYVCVGLLGEIRNQDVHIKLIQEELEDTQNDRNYYQSQYKKYFELSEELQNQMGVYYE